MEVKVPIPAAVKEVLFSLFLCYTIEILEPDLKNLILWYFSSKNGGFQEK
jgi:hypothetical protein